MADSLSQPTHEINHVLLEEGQHFLVLKPLKEGAGEDVVAIDELLADHLIGAQNVELRRVD